MTSGAKAGAREVPQNAKVAGFYDGMSMLLAELAGGSLHQGYWESPSDRSTMVEASQRLTDLMAEKIGVGSGSRVLDIGCGTGAPAVRLARSTGATVVGITNSPVQAELAVQRARDAGLGDRVIFRCEDATELSFPERSFDAMWMIESISHMPARLGALRQAARVLKPGGRLALTDILDRTPAPAALEKAVDELDQHAYSNRSSPLMAKPIRLTDYELFLDQAGLIPLEMTDISDHTVARSFAAMRQKLTEDREELVERFGSQSVERYESVLPLLKSADFGYGVVVATPPGQ